MIGDISDTADDSTKIEIISKLMEGNFYNFMLKLIIADFLICSFDDTSQALSGFLTNWATASKEYRSEIMSHIGKSIPDSQGTTDDEKFDKLIGLASDGARRELVSAMRYLDHIVEYQDDDED